MSQVASDRSNADPQQSRLLRVCRIGRAQGLKGEVNVYAFTDEPERRFSPGSVLTTADEARAFTVVSSRRFKSRWIVLFEGIEDRNASEALNGIELYAPADPPGEEEDDDAWYLDDLVGLEVRMAANNGLGRPAGELIGTVAGVIDAPAQQLIEVALQASNGSEPAPASLVPFVEQIVPEVEPEEGYIGIDPPKGLLPLD
ncbi:ribosome maturation factor RimM [Bombiscardovia apis]|uniref:Ribosome maturation factor RimM n=1 Tax=Bombiscardovia apis TaxID=2932182 RepID=A0ABM8BBA4_9BIFI|nr:ribosome maturation factor RimM [Bombiscardovia apis]BDR54186.1 ribosome maturation factor RimM [Bombiscardovia apis]